MAELPTAGLHYIAAALYGLVIGSFVNVLVARLPKGESPIRPASHCPGCKARIRWRDNIPLLSYLLLGGKCRSCKMRISIRYPVIELLTALVFVAACARFGWNSMLFVREWPFIVLLMAITFIDLEHRIIPDVLSLGGLGLGLATSWAVPGLGFVNSALGAALGFGSFYLLAWLYQARTGRAGLGGGDIKLLAMLGAFLGPLGVFVTVLISSVVGSIVGLGWGLASGKKNLMSVAIPFGPFLVVGGLYYYLLGDSLWLQFMTPM